MFKYIEKDRLKNLTEEVKETEHCIIKYYYDKDHRLMLEQMQRKSLSPLLITSPYTKEYKYFDNIIYSIKTVFINGRVRFIYSYTVYDEKYNDKIINNLEILSNNNAGLCVADLATISDILLNDYKNINFNNIRSMLYDGEYVSITKYQIGNIIVHPFNHSIYYNNIDIRNGLKLTRYIYNQETDSFVELNENNN